MKLKDAIQLIDNNYLKNKSNRVWADLGCGTGAFTMALAHLLPERSLICAVDKNPSSLKKIPDNYKTVTINKINSDFINDEFPGELDGILMANSFHYVRDKEKFIQKAVGHLGKDECFIIVEYDTETSNTWIPFPISYSSLKEVFEKAGFKVEKLGEKSSIYREENIYSVLTIRNNYK